MEATTSEETKLHEMPTHLVSKDTNRTKSMSPMQITILEQTKNKTKRTCLICQNVFYLYNSIAKSNPSKYCSRACYHESIRNGGIKKCETCKKEIYLSKGKIDQGRGKYCSNKCALDARRKKSDERNAHKKCEMCGEIFQAKIKTTTYKRRFCSKKCNALHRTQKIRLTCKNCGKEIERQPYRLKQSKYMYCSTRCAAHNTAKGENSPNWKGGISFEPYCPKFNADLKRRARDYFDNRCILCGKHRNEQDQELSVHHVEYDKNACCNGKPVHFAALCKNCHSKTHNNRNRWEKMLHVVIDEMYNGKSYYTGEEYEQMTKQQVNT